MLIQSQANSLPNARQTSGTPNNPGGTFGEALITELNPQYYALLKAGKVYTLATANVATVTAYVGTTGTTPIFGIYNPSTSGTDLVLLQVKATIRTTGTTAGVMGFNFWLGTQGAAAPTGAQTQPRNKYSGATAGSVSYCMVNTVNTGAVAATMLDSSLSLGNVTTTAGVNAVSLFEDIKGAIVVAPGNYLAWGNYVAMAVAGLDFSLTWAEIPA